MKNIDKLQQVIQQSEALEEEVNKLMKVLKMSIHFQSRPGISGPEFSLSGKLCKLKHAKLTYDILLEEYNEKANS